MKSAETERKSFCRSIHCLIGARLPAGSAAAADIGRSTAKKRLTMRMWRGTSRAFDWFSNDF
jgi:hypothetical protein